MKFIDLKILLRDKGYWFADLLKGNPVYKHYKSVSDHFGKNVFRKEYDNSDNLNLLLKHALENVPFYKEKHIHYPDITSFPVVNKNIIRNNYEKIRATDYRRKKNIIRTTSGSTGTPFSVYQDLNKKFRNHADTLWYAQKAGYQLGHKLFYFKIWSEKLMATPLWYRIQNIVPVDVLKLDDEKIRNITGKIKNSGSSVGIIGYSSALELICQYLDKNEKNFKCENVKSIIAISETLNDYTRERLQKYFGVPAFSRYSNLENGIIAQEVPGYPGKFQVNTASYYVEILKFDSDQPAGAGESGRIVVTDLFNYAMPMIRYDTGDVGSMIYDGTASGLRFLDRVEGRRLDLLYDTSGNLVSSYIVYKNMWQYTEIDQYQLIQEGKKKYLIKINCSHPFIREKQLIGEFKSYLGQDADLKVEYVKEIPQLSSGKRRKIVNNYIRT